MRSFDETLELMRIELEQSEGALILVGICNDTVLRDYTINELRKRLSPEISLRDFHYDLEHISLLEAAIETVQSGNGRVALSITGLEELPHDKWSEAIKLLNLQRNRFGYTGAAVILWVNRTTHAEIANKSADFFSWRSGTFIIEPPPNWDTLASVRKSYLHAVVAQNEFVNLQGLAPMRGGQIVQMRVDEIFVPLRAEYEVRETTLPRLLSDESETVARQEDANVDLEREARRSFLARGRQRVETRPVEIADMLKDRHAVVLGDPGTGKTTLLRYLTYSLAKMLLDKQPLTFLEQHPDLRECLPVYLRIGEYAQHCRVHPETTIDAFALTSAQARHLPLSKDLFEHEMQTNRVVFLLDGLDEITASGDRRDMTQRLEQFVSAHPQRRVIVTSRLVGYREAPLGQKFAQFTIRPFEKDDIRRFVDQWYAALQEPGSAAELCTAIEDSPSVRRLATNPLLLTVIALIHRRLAQLPHQRAKLYSLAAETLVDQWMTQRRVIPEGWDIQETVQTLLPAVAWHLHATTASGLIGEQALHDLLVDTLRQQDSYLREDEAHRRAAQFRRNVSEFSGIFLERGLDQEGRGLYGFLHLTFEEYFAAVRLADKWEREGKTALTPLLHDPRWTEVILLTAGSLSESRQYRATEFVKAVQSARSQYELILHRDLLLAARCLADDVRIDAAVRRGLVEKLVKLAFDKRSPNALREDLSRIFSRFAGVAAAKDLVQALLRALTDADGNVRGAAAQTFGRLGASVATPKVVQALLRALTDADEDVREAAAETFGQLGASVATPKVVQALLRALTDADEDVREAAAETFGQLGASVATPEVVQALLRALTDAEGNVRWAAVGTFGQLGASVAAPEVVQALLRALTDAEGYVRTAAVETFGQLGASVAAPEVVQALLRALTDADEYVRGAAVRTFGQLGASVATPEVVQALLRALTDAEWYVRTAAAQTLQTLSGFVHLKEWPEAPTLFVPLARSRNVEKRAVGYVCLRNLLAGGQEEAVQG